MKQTINLIIPSAKALNLAKVTLPLLLQEHDSLIIDHCSNYQTWGKWAVPSSEQPCQWEKGSHLVCLAQHESAAVTRPCRSGKCHLWVDNAHDAGDSLLWPGLSWRPTTRFNCHILKRLDWYANSKNRRRWKSAWYVLSHKAALSVLWSCNYVFLDLFSAG